MDAGARDPRNPATDRPFVRECGAAPARDRPSPRAPATIAITLARIRGRDRVKMAATWDGTLEIGRPILALHDDGIVFSSPVVRGFAVCGTQRIYIQTENSVYELDRSG